MPIFRIDSVGSVGIIKDQPPSLIPPAGWSDGRNIRFSKGNAYSALSSKLIIETGEFEPYWLLPCRTDTDLFELVMGLTGAMAFSANSLTDVTRASGPYTGIARDRWNGGVLNSIPVVNNGVDVPQYWFPIGTGQVLQDLLYWPEDTLAKVIRPFGNFLVALNVQKSTTRYPWLVKWSTSATPGNLPGTWDPADATALAGENPLADTQGPLVDALPIGNALALYKTDAVHLMTPVNNQFVFDFQRTPVNGGLLAQDCAQVLPNGTHFVVGMEDIYIFDGQSATSIIEDKDRDYLFGDISTQSYPASFTVRHPTAKQIWFVYPSQSNTIPNKAAVWDMLRSTWSFYDLNELHYAFGGLFNPFAQVETWDAGTGSWDSDPYVWDTAGPIDFFRSILAACPTNISALDVEENASKIAYLERQDIAYERQAADGTILTDQTTYKFFRELWLQTEGTLDAPLVVKVGLQDRPQGPVTWLDPFEWRVGQNYPIGVFAQARLFTIRIEAPLSPSWALTGYSMDISSLGING